jgi:hypothetical protein
MGNLTKICIGLGGHSDRSMGKADKGPLSSSGFETGMNLKRDCA